MRYIEKEIFENKHVVVSRLQAFGFHQEGNRWVYEKSIMNDSFLCQVIVEGDQLDCDCIDVMTDESYDAIFISYQNGSFVSQVRQEYLDCLNEIANTVCETLPFHSEQAKRISVWINEMFHENVVKLKSETNAYAYQNKENDKKYVVIYQLTHPDEKQNKKLEILNVKTNPEDVISYLNREGFYPAWHQSKKTWVSVILDDSLTDEMIQDLISASRGFTLSKKVEQKKEEIHQWLIPSNPIYFDIVGAMEQEETITWKQTSSIHQGDDVYLYVGKPYSAIMYHFEAIEVGLDYGGEVSGRTKLMILRKKESFDPRILTLSKMREYGTNTPRGPRNMPQNLIEILKNAKNE